MIGYAVAYMLFLTLFNLNVFVKHDGLCERQPFDNKFIQNLNKSEGDALVRRQRKLTSVPSFTSNGCKHEKECRMNISKIKALQLHSNLLESFLPNNGSLTGRIFSDIKVLSLGRNKYPCNCSISWLWKDFIGIYNILPRYVLGFHFYKTPPDFGSALPKEIPPLTCYDAKDHPIRGWGEVNLLQCNDEYSEAILDEWSTWTPCTANCGIGSRRRQHKYKLFDQGLCSGEMKQTEICMNRLCKKMEQLVEMFIKYSSRCDKGVTCRTKTCENPTPQRNGKVCIGLKKQRKNCTTFCKPKNLSKIANDEKSYSEGRVEFLYVVLAVEGFIIIVLLISLIVVHSYWRRKYDQEFWDALDFEDTKLPEFSYDPPSTKSFNDHYINYEVHRQTAGLLIGPACVIPDHDYLKFSSSSKSNGMKENEAVYCNLDLNSRKEKSLYELKSKSSQNSKNHWTPKAQ